MNKILRGQLILAVLICGLLALSCNVTSKAVSTTTTPTVSAILDFPPTTSPASIDMNYSTIKYDSQGQKLWTAQHNPDSDWVSAMTVDKNGNTYVTGDTTIKYDNNGNQIWSVHHSSTHLIGIDDIGNVLLPAIIQ